MQLRQVSKNQKLTVGKRISGTDQAISIQMFKAGNVVNVTTGFDNGQQNR